MRFSIVLLLLLLVVALTGCEEEGNGVANINTIDTIDELNEFVSGINYVFNLEDGNTFSFTPSRDFTPLAATSFSSMGGGFNYSGNALNVGAQVSDKAKLTLFLPSIVTIDLDYGVCTDVESIKLAYPDIAIDPLLDDYLVFVATTKSGLSEEEIIFGGPARSELYIQVLLNPNDPDSFRGIVADSQNYFFMDGSFYLDSNGMVSVGTMRDPSTNVRIDYGLEFFCN